MGELMGFGVGDLLACFTCGFAVGAGFFYPLAIGRWWMSVMDLN